MFYPPTVESGPDAGTSYVEQLQSLRDRSEADGLFLLTYFLDVALVEAESLREPRSHIRPTARGAAIANDPA